MNNIPWLPHCPTVTVTQHLIAAARTFLFSDFVLTSRGKAATFLGPWQSRTLTANQRPASRTPWSVTAGSELETQCHGQNSQTHLNSPIDQVKTWSFDHQWSTIDAFLFLYILVLRQFARVTLIVQQIHLVKSLPRKWSTAATAVSALYFLADPSLFISEADSLAEIIHLCCITVKICFHLCFLGQKETECSQIVKLCLSLPLLTPNQKMENLYFLRRLKQLETLDWKSFHLRQNFSDIVR